MAGWACCSELWWLQQVVVQTQPWGPSPPYSHVELRDLCWISARSASLSLMEVTSFSLYVHRPSLRTNRSDSSTLEFLIAVLLFYFLITHFPLSCICRLFGKKDSFLKAGFWIWKSVGSALLDWVTLHRGYSQQKVMNHTHIRCETGNLHRAACELSHAFVAWVTSITQKQRLGCRTWVCPGRILQLPVGLGGSSGPREWEGWHKWCRREHYIRLL